MNTQNFRFSERDQNSIVLTSAPGLSLGASLKNNKMDIKSSLLSNVLNQVAPKRIRKSQYLTPTSFAYDIMEFKYDSKHKRYELKGIYHEGVREYLSSVGIFKRYINKDKAILIKQEGCFIEEISSENIKDVFQEYIFSLEDTIKFKHDKVDYNIPSEAIRNYFLKQSNLFFNDRWLEHLEEHTTPILKDTKKYCYVVFRNCFVQISKKDKVEVFELDKLAEKCIWKSQRIEKDYKKVDDYSLNPFVQFFKNVTSGIEGRYDALRGAFGYLIHNFFSPADGKAVLLYDEALTDKTKPMGGTGKGLCANALTHIRSQVKIDGKHWDSTNRFRFELVKPGSQIVWIDETKPDFKFDSMFSCLTDGWTIERKYLPQFFIKPADSPKVLICSNTIISNIGSSNKRRQFIVELNDYYSKKIITGSEKPIEEEHGLLFGEQWSAIDWNEFYSFMIDCVSHYFEVGLVPYELKNVSNNLLQQKTSPEFIEWIEGKNLQINVEYNTKDLFEDFKISYLGEDSNFKQRGFTNWLKLYGSTNLLNFNNSTSGGIAKFSFTKN